MPRLTANCNDPLTEGLISHQCSASHHWLSTQRLVECEHTISASLLAKARQFPSWVCHKTDDRYGQKVNLCDVDSSACRSTEVVIKYDDIALQRLRCSSRRPNHWPHISLLYFYHPLNHNEMRERLGYKKEAVYHLSLNAPFILYLWKLCIRNHINSKGNMEPCKILLIQMGKGKIDFIYI